MKTTTAILLTLAASVPTTWFISRGFHTTASTPTPAAPDSAPQKTVLFYQSPMHPWIKSDKPGRCTICGMNLTPVFAGETPRKTDASIVTLEPGAISALHVTKSAASVRPIVKTMRFPGMIDDNASRHRYLSAYTAGRIDKLHVTYEGQEVTAGQPLAEFYSPTLLAAEREYRLLSGDLRDQASLRLRQLGLSQTQIAALGDKAPDALASSLLAPMGGTVVARNVYEGQYVQEGERLFEIADFSTMWFIFNVFENDLGWLREEQTVSVTTPSLPGREFKGTVTFIDPNLDENTRSAKVRVELPNPVANGRRTFLHRLSGEGLVTVDAPAALSVPRSAVLQTGRQAVVFVDLGGGGYERTAVTLGRRGDDLVEILGGLEEGDEVVTNGNLLLDSQAELNRPGQPASAPPAPTEKSPAAPPVHTHGS